MRLKRSAKNTAFINLVLPLLFGLFSSPASAKINYYEALKELTGKNGTVYVADRDGTPLVKINETKKLVPASILKVITASAAYHYLKEDYHFRTEFYAGEEGSLYVKGYGDPILISEELEIIAGALSEKGIKRIRDIYLDNSYFDGKIKIDGVERSINPYDATNGALCVNFNTINVTLDKDGSITSREPQTPMTAFAKEIVRRKIKVGEVRKRLDERVVLSHEKEETLLYVGHLLKAFLSDKGIKVTGEIKKGRVGQGLLIYTHYNTKSLDDVVTAMMKYSNNFTANQVFLMLGAHVFGPPATVKKGVDAVLRYLKDEHGVTDVTISEGSGISRKNKISASDFMKVLYNYREEHIETLNGKEDIVYKTGTLNDVKSAAGFIRARNGDIYSFIIMLNDERDVHKRGKIIKLIKGMIFGED